MLEHGFEPASVDLLFADELGLEHESVSEQRLGGEFSNQPPSSCPLVN
jgi:hypothetical protein